MTKKGAKTAEAAETEEVKKSKHVLRTLELRKKGMLDIISSELNFD